LITVGE